jgi:dienelactone hydrolase
MTHGLSRPAGTAVRCASPRSRSADGTPCAAWLYRPGSGGEVPCVVLAHGFGAVRELRLDAYAERFAAAGLAALVFDYRQFDVYVGEAFERAVRDQTAFLARHLLGGSVPSPAAAQTQPA